MENEYEHDAHGGGVGKHQKPSGKSAGVGRGHKTPHAEHIPHRGHGAEAHGYNKDAHTHKHHGPNGEAVGHVGDNEPMGYHGQLQGEGRVNRPIANIKGSGHERVGMAEHHQHPVGEPHSFGSNTHALTHGYNHAPSQRKGIFRLSGHSGAHMIGRRKK